MEAPFLNEIWKAFGDAKDFLPRRLSEFDAGTTSAARAEAGSS